MSIARFLAPAVGLLMLASTALPVVAQQAPSAPKASGDGKTGAKAAEKLHRIGGRIKAVTESSLVITDRHNKEITLTLDTATTLEKAEKGDKGQGAKAQHRTITAKELSAGDAVVVHYVESDGKKMVKSVRVRPGHGGGGHKGGGHNAPPQKSQ